jgi:hypothetical protein
MQRIAPPVGGPAGAVHLTKHKMRGKQTMVVNNLLVKLKDRGKDKMEEAKNVLPGLRDNIPALLDSHVEAGINAGKSSYS